MSLLKVSLPLLITLFICSNSLANDQKSIQNQKIDLQKKRPSIEMLNSINDLKTNLKKRINKKKERLKNSTSKNQKDNLKKEIEILDKHLEDASKDFERVAVGIDTTLFSIKKEESFDWKDEVLALIKPGINELKRLTLKTRKKSKLKDQIFEFEEKIPHAKNAIKNINDLISKTDNKEIKTKLHQLLNEWVGIEKQLKSKAKVARLKLKQMEGKKKSIVESTQESVKNFFKSKGLFILVAVFVCTAIVILLRFVKRLLIKKIPGYNHGGKNFTIKAFDLFFRALTFILALFSVIFIFYTAQDWTLLSFTIIAILGLGWALKAAIPKLWLQCRLILNIGPVREGERITYQGIPWLVNDINFYSTIVNPDIDLTLRLPIEALIGQVSRPVQKNEPWFPCRKNDWVILSDGIRGKAVSLSNEMVELVMRGGAHKIYQTPDFLALSPLNISRNFRIKVSFGLSYDLQKDITKQIPKKITAYILQQLKTEGYMDVCLNLNTEFENASDSTLDIVVIGDFSGKAAQLYNRLRRAIQRWCVDFANENNWEIPFPQLTIHKTID